MTKTLYISLFHFLKRDESVNVFESMFLWLLHNHILIPKNKINNCVMDKRKDTEQRRR